MVVQLVGNCSKQVTMVNSITEAKYVAALEATKTRTLNHIVLHELSMVPRRLWSTGHYCR